MLSQSVQVDVFVSSFKSKATFYTSEISQCLPPSARWTQGCWERLLFTVVGTYARHKRWWERTLLIEGGLSLSQYDFRDRGYKLRKLLATFSLSCWINNLAHHNAKSELQCFQGRACFPQWTAELCCSYYSHQRSISKQVQWKLLEVRPQTLSINILNVIQKFHIKAH